MKIKNGVIEPGLRIGELYIGSERTEVISNLGKPCKFRISNNGKKYIVIYSLVAPLSA